MHERESLESLLTTLGASDPRIGDEYVRIVESAGHAPVILVGVVHDHPASIHRVRTIIDTLEPEVLGLELPSLATPLFEQFAGGEGDVETDSAGLGALTDGGSVDAEAARAENAKGDVDPEAPDGWTGHAAGGEMTAAITAADDARIVGLDMPDRRSLTSLAATMWREGVSSATMRTVAEDVWRLSRHAAESRLVAAGLPQSIVKHELGGRHRYEVSPADPPAVQADHEHGHVRKSRALLQSLEPPAATRLVDDVRERSIGDRLTTLRTETTEPMVAVVGYNHLDRVAEAMSETAG